MRVWAFATMAVRELVALIVDDVVTFTGGVVGLVGAYFVAHHSATLRPWAGFGLFAVFWLGLALSFRLAVREGRPTSPPAALRRTSQVVSAAPSDGDAGPAGVSGRDVADSDL